MMYMDLQALRHYVRQAQKIIYETRGCIIIGCDKCECAYICEYDLFCARERKAYAICNDLFNACRYLYDTIREREALELHRDTQESK